MDLSTYGNSCPKNGDLYAAKSVTVPKGVGMTATAQAGTRGVGLSVKGVVGAGLSYTMLKGCRIFVMDKDVTDKCCE
ncbi:MAG TPA: hypothetical protein EYH19_08275 [Desulfocapsa sulfexigens]|nr:hypothetical protein [Desulfocapsa sulfexigens]